MRVVWTRAAQQDRAAIWDYLEARNPAAAARIDQFFSDAAAQLADFPMSGHIGEIAGTRELTPHRSYRLIYEIMRDEVWVLVLIHTARQWPPMRGENKPLDAIEEDGEPPSRAFISSNAVAEKALSYISPIWHTRSSRSFSMLVT